MALHAQEETDTIIYEDPPPIEEFTEAQTYTAKDAAEPAVPAKYTGRKFEPGLKERYNDDDFKYKEEDRPKENWATRFLAWVRKVWRSIFGSDEDEEASDSVNMVVGYRIVALLAILAVIYIVAKAILQKEGMWIFGRSVKKIIASDVAAENIHEMDFATLIEKTKNDGDYRLALRYYYLWLLKKLSAREIIQWNWDKTNTDYFYEIKDNNLRDDFKYLSYVYDYSWYGEFEVDEKAFGKAEKAFKKTMNIL